MNCGAEFAIKTDPKNSTYVVESGATRNSNIQLNERQQEMEDQRKREEAESMDAIKALENRTEEMKREMDIYDSLDLVLAQTRKTMNTDPETAIDILRQRDEKKKKKEEEAAKVELENKDKKEMGRVLASKEGGGDCEQGGSLCECVRQEKGTTKAIPETRRPDTGRSEGGNEEKEEGRYSDEVACLLSFIRSWFGQNDEFESTMYSLFADNGDVVYIEDEWNEGRKRIYPLPFLSEMCQMQQCYENKHGNRGCVSTQ